ncbi:hypothetical protein DFH09DRAFT_2549 [Mycena vulgaris]|nr:hypothetical protein DFH09DRAFT_2549 [Mycena vulgaris]
MPNVGGLQCYANSAIQGITAAISLRDFRRLVKPDPVSNSIRGTFLRTVARLIGGDQTDLVSLLRIVSTTHRREIKANAETPSYDGDSQEDPAEFLLFLLDKLWEAHSEMKNLVTFTQRTTTKCSNPLCNTESVNITHNYTQLVLRVKAQDTMCTLYDALAPDTVETWRCPKECKTLSQKTVSFDTLPGILVVQLERTEHFFPGQTTEINGVKESVYNSVVKARQEYQKKVVEWEARLQQRRAAGMPTTDLDEEFKKWKNLQEGIPVKLDTPVDLFSADHSSFQTFNLTSDDEKTPVQYELYAVMCHKGETNIAGGHCAYRVSRRRRAFLFFHAPRRRICAARRRNEDEAARVVSPQRQ